MIDQDSIDRAALSLIAESGVDGLSIPRLASALGSTTGPLYRRYDTATDVAHDLWERVLRAHLRRVASAALVSATEPPPVELEWLRDELRRPSRETSALLHVIAGARRLGPAGEEIRRQIESDVEGLVARQSVLPPVMVVAHVAPVLGALLVRAVWPSMPIHVADELPTFARAYHDRRHWSMSSAHLPYQPPAAPTIESDDVTLDDLRRAVVHVVAVYGCADATTSRISRHAGRSVTSAYRRLGNKHQLISDAIDHALRTDFGFTGTESAAAVSFATADRHARSVQTLRNQIDERNHDNRMFFLEVLVASLGDPILREPVARWAATTQGKFLAALSEIPSSGERDTLVARWEVRIAAGLGALVLSTVIPRWLAQNDPMPAIAANDAITSALSSP